MISLLLMLLGLTAPQPQHWTETCPAAVECRASEDCGTDSDWEEIEEECSE